MLPVQPSQSPTKRCHSRLAHSAATLMIREPPVGAHVELHDCACVGPLHLLATFVSVAIMCNECRCSDQLLTGGTEKSSVAMQLPPHHPHPATPPTPAVHPVIMSKLGRELATGTHRFAPADGKPQQWSLWWPAFPLISWLMYREKPGAPESHWLLARLPTTPVLCNVLISAVGCV